MTRLPPVIVCGTVRNAAAALSATLRAIERLRPAFERSEVHIVTNDNTDATDAVLCTWRDPPAGRVVLRLDGLASEGLRRSERLAKARNAYLDHLRARSDLADWPLVLVLDLDGPNERLEPHDLIAPVKALSAPWTALFANQHQAYYDVFALRHSHWCPGDQEREVREAKRRALPWRRAQAKREARARLIHARQYRIPPETPPIPVSSAFGGLGLYRTQPLVDCRYDGRDRTNECVCEHVPLHEQLGTRGEALFILPALRNDAPTEHLGALSGAPFPPSLAKGGA